MCPRSLLRRTSVSPQPTMALTKHIEQPALSRAGGCPVGIGTLLVCFQSSSERTHKSCSLTVGYYFFLSLEIKENFKARLCTDQCFICEEETRHRVWMHSLLTTIFLPPSPTQGRLCPRCLQNLLCPQPSPSSPYFLKEWLVKERVLRTEPPDSPV